jgi:hypothetical protein
MERKGRGSLVHGRAYILVFIRNGANLRQNEEKVKNF